MSSLNLTQLLDELPDDIIQKFKLLKKFDQKSLRITRTLNYRAHDCSYAPNNRNNAINILTKLTEKAKNNQLKKLELMNSINELLKNHIQEIERLIDDLDLEERVVGNERLSREDAPESNVASCPSNFVQNDNAMERVDQKVHEYSESKKQAELRYGVKKYFIRKLAQFTDNLMTKTEPKITQEDDNPVASSSKEPHKLVSSSVPIKEGRWRISSSSNPDALKIKFTFDEQEHAASKSSSSLSPENSAPIESTKATEVKQELYCICNGAPNSDMIACDYPGCKLEWYHFKCVKVKVIPKGKWFCPDCKEKMKQEQGSVVKKSSKRK